MAKPIVLIHGAFCGGWCFADFVPVLAERGFTCHARDLRFHVSGPAREPDPRLAHTSIADYTRDMAELVASLPEPPVIIGHSMGGIIGLQLAAKGLARSLVLIASGAPWGILPSTDDELALATGLMQASPFWDRALNPSFEVARQDSLASLSPEAQRRVFDQFSPESGRALFELFFWMFDTRRTTEVDTGKVTCPVLVVSGSEDKGRPAGRSRSSTQAPRSTKPPAAATS
jgi:non-heme chloroperoxidase